VNVGGVRVGGVAAGVKPGKEPDMAVIIADRAVPTAAVFTSSRSAAAPVVVSRAHVADGFIRAVVVNSGCANAGTGESGILDARRMAAAAAGAIGCSPDEVIVCSTGPIGPPLPMEAVMPGIGAAVTAATAAGWESAAAAIMTTDTHPKLVESTMTVDGGTVRTVGMAKGAGMVRPDMATMLAFLVTDALVEPSVLRRVLGEVVDRTFNSMNIDGCQSTNDTVVAMATGASSTEVPPDRLVGLLEGPATRLAEMIVRDAEGSTRLVTVRVVGAADAEQARHVGLAITDSDLVRASFHGGDPNWGRIFGAVGVSGLEFAQSSFAVAYEDTWIARDGRQVPFDRLGLRSRLVGDFQIDVVVGDGPGEARILSCDLSPDYVRFNAEPS